MGLAVPDVCTRFPYATLVLYRNFNTNTVAELIMLLMTFDRHCPEFGVWLRSISESVLEKTRSSVSTDCRGNPVS
jgi:hypothetical protein